MAQCEMCGAETPSPKTVKIEGAELEVCEDCAELGTEVQTQETSSTSTKYSTSSSGSDSSSSTGGATGGSGGGGGSRRDMFDEMDTLVDDYDQRIREARESRGQSQEELAKDLNEKASLIRKLERGDVLPSDDVQRKLERALGIDLDADGEAGEGDWDSGDAAEGLTLGDMVKRKD
jgi:putative transcription factor